jgi:hypothetical protein
MAGDSPTQHPEESSPDRQTVASVARQGTVLGQCLGEALASLQQQDEESSPSAKRRKVQLDTSAVNRILQASTGGFVEWTIGSLQSRRTKLEDCTGRHKTTIKASFG